MAEHRGGSGNFAEDKEKASEAGRKGGRRTEIRQLILLLIFRKYILKYCAYDAGHRLAFFYSDRELF